MSRQLPQHLQSLSHAEHRALLRVAQDRDHQLFKNLGAPLDQIEMPVRSRIKRSRINSDAFVQSSSQEQEGLNRRFYAGGSEDGNAGRSVLMNVPRDCHPARSEGPWFLLAALLSSGRFRRSSAQSETSL